ncbi:MAG: hypothetical protein E6G10_21300 [Actinobacteria bacterium]|nr:MAG: hypothetical protein E6G10_21300 [Actinomycetota bacterium]
MRPRLQRITERRRRSAERRRGHAPAARPPLDPAAPQPEPRIREAFGGPKDLATYTCVCGFQWEARVSTTVDCPHCGAGQAW